MTLLHTEGWGSDAPTPAQFKDFFELIGQGKITKANFEQFLRQRRASRESQDQTAARQIMGANYHGLGHVCKLFGLRYHEEQRKQLATIPFSREILEACKRTHVLFPGIPITVKEMMELRSALFGVDNSMLSSFSQEKVELRWYLLRKDPVAGSLDGTYGDQCHQVAEDERPASFSSVVLAMLLHNTQDAATQNRFANGYDVRCGADHLNTQVAYWDGGWGSGCVVTYVTDSYAHCPTLGLASERIP